MDRAFYITLSNEQSVVLEQWRFGVVRHPGPKNDLEHEILREKYDAYWTDKEIEEVYGYDVFEKEILRTIKLYI